MTLKVCLAGVTGWVGRPLADAIAQAEDLELAAAAARRSRGSVIAGVTVAGSVREALATPSDVFVDYTSAESARANVLDAVAAGRHVVIGSSGLTEDDFVEIEASARSHGVGVIAVGNFAISAALLQKFAVDASRYFPAWEIVEYAHDSKVDAPGGTARELAWRLGQAGSPQPEVPLEKTVGPRESRGATINRTQIHSVRLPGHTLGIDVLFGREDERLTIRYESGAGAGPYIAGTLRAIRRAPQVTGLLRGLDQIL